VGADVHHQAVELLDCLHVDWCLVILAIKRDTQLVLTYILFYQNINLASCLTVPAFNFGVVSDLCAWRKLLLN